MNEYCEILSKTFLFKEIDVKTIQECCNFEGICEHNYSQGEIMQNALSKKQIGIILKGKAVILSSDDGVIIKKLGKNDIFGVAIMFDNEPKYSTRVVSASSSTVLLLSKDFLLKCFSKSPKIVTNYLEELASKISFLNAKISSYTAKSAENKLLAYLMQLPRENNVVFLNTDFSSIAKMIGIGRASLYRAFDKLISDGIIEKDNKKIILKEI